MKGRSERVLIEHSRSRRAELLARSQQSSALVAGDAVSGITENWR